MLGPPNETDSCDVNDVTVTFCAVAGCSGWPDHAAGFSSRSADRLRGCGLPDVVGVGFAQVALDDLATGVAGQLVVEDQILGLFETSESVTQPVL